MERVGLSSQYRWRLLQEKPALRDGLARTLGLHPLVAQLLVNRQVETAASGREFLDPRLSGLPDPAELPDFAAALTVLARARSEGTPVLVHGDYDVDGLCGSTLLVRLFRMLGIRTEVYLPDRFTDGYSFSRRSLAEVQRLGAGVVVAVDNGTTALEALAALAAAGVAVVVVDHHRPGPELPRCAALLNPWVAADTGLFPWFCGTGVAWLLAWGLLREIGGQRQLPERERRFLLDMLGLAALATVADVMPLQGPNRALVANGLQALGGSGLPGLRALLEVSGVRGAPTATDLGYRLAPRLNAAGRLGKAEAAFGLLTTASGAEAQRFAATLDALNTERKEVELREMERFRPEAEAVRSDGGRLLFLGRKDAHFGVLGIVANRLTEATGLPALLWSECEPGLCRGSARAPEGVNLVATLDTVADLLRSYGGHERAAGFSFETRNAGELGRRLAETAAPEPARPALQIDAEVAAADLDAKVVRQLERLGPFGEGNPEPLFLASDLQVADPPRLLGDGSHASLLLERHGSSVRGLGWRMAARLDGVQAGDRLDVVFHAAINEFRGRRAVEWTLRDLRSALDPA